MKNLTEQQYADELIEKYIKLKQAENFGWSGMSLQMAIQCAKIDVQNTIDSLKGIADYKRFDYYTKVLTILNDMK